MLRNLSLDKGLVFETDRLLAVNTALDSKLLALMMSMHARLGAGSGLRVLNDSIVMIICDVFRRESKASSLLDEADAEKEEDEDSDSSGEEEEAEEEEEEEDV